VKNDLAPGCPSHQLDGVVGGSTGVNRNHSAAKVLAVLDHSLKNSTLDLPLRRRCLHVVEADFTYVLGAADQRQKLFESLRMLSHQFRVETSRGANKSTTRSSNWGATTRGV